MLFFFCFLFSLFLGFTAHLSWAFSYSDSGQAWYSYSARVEMEQVRRPTPAQAKIAAEDQARYLFGPWAFSDPIAVPRPGADIQLGEIEKIGNAKFAVHYHYRGAILLQKKASGIQNNLGQLDAILPLNPKTIYEAAKVKDQTPCTDPTYPSKESFWYFWAPAPHHPKCPLIEGIDYIRVSGRFERILNTSESFPDYSRLVDAQTGSLEISVFFGMDRIGLHSPDPDTSADENAKKYLAVRSSLINLGYELDRLRRDERQSLLSDQSVNASHFTYERLTLKTPRALLVVNLYFGPTLLNEKGRAFHQLYRIALGSHSVVIHSGPSELGLALDPETIEQERSFQFSIPKERYQIFFFNSSPGYSSYIDHYFQRKKTRQDPRGIRNLDIVADWTPAHSGRLSQAALEKPIELAVLNAVDHWARTGSCTSYTRILESIPLERLVAVTGEREPSFD
ncbi:MAG: hypothetical protein ACK5QT_09070 [Oligoflexia bacterium]